MCTVELLVQEMQKQVDVQPQVPLEKVHELVRLELCLKKVFDRHKRACPRDLYMAARSLNVEYSDLVAGYREVDLVPVSFTYTTPRNQDASL